MECIVSAVDEDRNSVSTVTPCGGALCVPFVRIFSTMMKLRRAIATRVNIYDIDDFSFEDYMKIATRYGLSELLLEVTTACNFACRYCIFSGIYSGFRTHGKEFMSLDTAIRAVDLYYSLIERYRYTNIFRRISISFYGGEPLLNFNLIKHVVEYANKRFDKYRKNLIYTITTNGSMLGNYAEFLIQNDFAVFVSLDGPREVHDMHRVRIDGAPTFDLVMDNIEQYFRVATKLGKMPQLYAIATWTIKSDLFRVREFFNKVKDRIRLVFGSFIRPFDLKIEYSSEDIQRFNEMEKTLREEFLYDYVKNRKWLREPDVFFDVFYGQRILLLAYRYKLVDRSGLLPFGSPCLPLYRLYVTVNGSILPCEKSPSSLIIGDVYNGLNFESIRKLIKAYSDYQKRFCASCPIRFDCQSCSALIFPIDWSGSKCGVFRRTFIDSLNLLVDVIKVNREYLDYLAQNTQQTGLYLLLQR